MKKTIIIWTVFLITVISACQNSATTPDAPVYVSYKGETMGTTYSVNCKTLSVNELQTKIDELLIELNAQLSTYIPDSKISLFNQSSHGVKIDKNLDFHFLKVYKEAARCYHLSDGSFDPTVMPLVNYWGFGYSPKTAIEKIDSSKIKSIMEHIGFHKVEMRSDSLIKHSPEVQLDMSALAKGYGVDQIGELLESNGSYDYLIEIGGEILAKGESPRSGPWNVAINTPDPNADIRDHITTTPLKNMALATSGNYRNFHIGPDSIPYAHTINPQSGYPEKNQLLSTSVKARTCMEADAIATSCMVMGFKRATQFINSTDSVEACFIVATPEGKMQLQASPGMNMK